VRTLAAALLLAGALPALPSWLHLPTRFERWLYNPRERTGVALRELAARRPAAALRPLETAARLAPDEPLAQLNAGAGALAAGQARRAVDYLEKAAAAAPPDLMPAAQYDLGTAHLAAGDGEQALQALKQALRLDPGNGDAKHNLELALRQLAARRPQLRAPQEAPGGRRPGESESSPSAGAQEPAPPEAEPQPQPPPQPQDPGAAGEQRVEGRPEARAGGEVAGSPLPEFRQQPEMSAEQAAALLEAVENLERQQRRAQAAARARRTRAGERDW
jgi:tetratricopeptide (TPR) repeat protein